MIRGPGSRGEQGAGPGVGGSYQRTYCRNTVDDARGTRKASVTSHGEAADWPALDLDRGPGLRFFDFRPESCARQIFNDCVRRNMTDHLEFGGDQRELSISCSFLVEG